MPMNNAQNGKQIEFWNRQVKGESWIGAVA